MRLVMLNHPMAAGSVRWFDLVWNRDCYTTTATEIAQPKHAIQDVHFDEENNLHCCFTTFTVCCVYGPCDGIFMSASKVRNVTLGSSLLIDWNKEDTIAAIRTVLDAEERKMQDEHINSRNSHRSQATE